MAKKEKLHKTEFYNVYGISLCLNSDMIDHQQKSWLCTYLQEVAEKYVRITLFACRKELQHARYGGTKDCSVWAAGDRELSNLGIDPKRIRTIKERSKIDFKKAAELFRKIDWCSGYGSCAWAEIAESGLKLKQLLPALPENMEKVICCIDYLNDLEHNNALYLEANCDFNLAFELDEKCCASPENIIKNCSSSIAKIARELGVHKQLCLV